MEEISIPIKLKKAIETFISSSAKKLLASEESEKGRMLIRQTTLETDTPDIIWAFDGSGKVISVYKTSSMSDEDSMKIHSNNEDSMHAYKTKLKKQYLYA